MSMLPLFVWATSSSLPCVKCMAVWGLVRAKKCEGVPESTGAGRW